MSSKGAFIGLNTIDIQFLIDRGIEENLKYKAEKTGIYVGGPSTNAAISFSYLGGKSQLFSPIGDHHFSNFIHEDLKKNNVEIVDLVAGKKTEPTIASVITSTFKGNRTIFSYHPKPINIEINSYAVNETDIILVDGFYLEAAIEIIKDARQNSIPVILDGGSWKPNMEKLLPFVDIAICSENYFPPKTKSQDEVFVFLNDSGIEQIAITNGEKPIKYSINDSVGQIYIEKVKAIDTLGAGDFFHGAFCYYYSLGNDFIGSLLKASKIAGKSCEYFGTREWMEKNEGNEKVT